MRHKRLFPRYDGDKGWLYLLERGDGTIKVGFTRCPANRISQHRTDSKRRGGLVRFHLFGAVPRLRVIAAEKSALAALARVAKRVENTEEFRGITFDAALIAVRASTVEA